MRGYHTCQIVKTEQQRAEAARILRKAWIDCEPLTAAEQRFRIGDFSRSLLWRIASTLEDPDLLKAADDFYLQCLERDPSLPPLSEQAAFDLRWAVERAALEYFKKHERT